MKSRSIQLSRRAFTTLELLIGIGLTAGIVLVSVIGLKKMATTVRIEAIKTDIVTRHRDAKILIANDMKHAQKIQGSTGYKINPAVSGHPTAHPMYYAVSRFNPWHYPAVDQSPLASDSLVIHKEVYPELAGTVVISNGSAGTKYLQISYVLESGDPANPTDKDLFFKSAIENKKYFFISNSEYRNIIQRSTIFSTAGSPCPTTCINDNCPTGYCYSFHGFIEDAAGDDIQPIRSLINVGEFARVDSNIRVGERIDYFVSGVRVAGTTRSSSACPEGSLCRRVDGRQQTDQIILPQVSRFQVFYKFDPDSSLTVMPSNPIRSPGDPLYQSDVAAASWANKVPVNFSNVAYTDIKIKESLPQELVDLLGPNAKDSAFESDGAGGFDYASMMLIRPGRGIEGTVGYDIGWGSDPNCPSLSESQCNPTGKCNYLFRNNIDPASPFSTKYQYKAGDAFCECGWHGEESPARFYDPSNPDNFAKIPYLTNQTSTAFGLPAPYDTIPVDANASNACARYYKCGEQGSPTNFYMDQRNPLCPFVRMCIRKEKNSLYWDANATPNPFNQSALANDLAANVGDHHYYFCHHNTYGHGCDDLYNLSLDIAPMSGTAKTFFQRTCACTVREYDKVNADNTYDHSTGLDMPWENLDFDSLCWLPNSFAAKNGFQCNTSSYVDGSGRRVWIAQDDARSQALPMRLAQLCACRNNHGPDGSNVPAAFYPISWPDFPYNASFYGDNQVIDPDGTGWGYAGSWALYDYQFRGANSIFDFRVNNPLNDNRMLTSQVGQAQNPWNPLVNPSTTPTPSSAPAFDPTPLPRPPTAKTSSYWFACGVSGPSTFDSDDLGAPVTNPKCMSYKSQWAYARIDAAGKILGRNIDCSREQYVLSKGRFRSPGACLETSHTETLPPHFPSAIVSNELIFKYRFFCDSDCGAGPYQGFDYQFTNEVNYIRSLIRARVGETDPNASWCPDISAHTTPMGSGSGFAFQPILGGTGW